MIFLSSVRAAASTFSLGWHLAGDSVWLGQEAEQQVLRANELVAVASGYASRAGRGSCGPPRRSTSDPLGYGEGPGAQAFAGADGFGAGLGSFTARTRSRLLTGSVGAGAT